MVEWIYNTLKREWPAIRQAPLAFFTFILIGFILGWLACSIIKPGQIDVKVSPADYQYERKSPRRELTPEQRQTLAESLKESKLKTIVIGAVATPEAQAYAKQFATVAASAELSVLGESGYNPFWPVGLIDDDPDAKGIYVGVPDENHPSDNGVALKKALEKADFKPRYTSFDRISDYGADFMLVINAPD